jgi:hypothetical protein
MAASQAIHVAAELDIPELLHERPRTCDEIASATSTDAWTLGGVLRVLAACDILAIDSDDVARMEGRKARRNPVALSRIARHSPSKTGVERPDGAPSGLRANNPRRQRRIKSTGTRPRRDCPAVDHTLVYPSDVRFSRQFL